MRRLLFLSLLPLMLFFSGCAPKELTLASFNPAINPIKEGKISTYNPKRDTIMVYTYTQKAGKIIETIDVGKVLPFRIEFMDLWVSGLGHDLRRITHNHAETLKESLMYGAEQKGMQILHVGDQDFVIDNDFAQQILEAVRRYEDNMKHYERDRRIPLLKEL
jgi:hypothetical protein